MEIVKYDVNEAEISKMSDIYMKLTIDGLDDQEGFDSVHTTHMVMVKHRTSIDKLRKSANETAQKFIKNNNANAKKLTSLMEPIETHLKTEKDKITKEKERIKAEEEALEKERIQKRVDALLAANVVMPFFDVAMMTEQEYKAKLCEALEKMERERERKEAEERKLEEERLELERLRKKEEADRKAETDRLEKLGKEQAIEAERLAKIQTDIDAKTKALKDEQNRLETDKKTEQARKDLGILEEWLAKEAKEKAEKEASIKAERELREQQEREATEVAEKARQETLLPDKTKLLNFADLIHVLASGNFNMKSVEAQALYAATLYTISDLETNFRKEIKEL